MKISAGLEKGEQKIASDMLFLHRCRPVACGGTASLQTKSFERPMKIQSAMSGGKGVNFVIIYPLKTFCSH